MTRSTPLRVPPLGPAECQVWWARPADCQPAHRRLLDAVEARRREAFRAPVDQARFTLGVVLTRTVLGALLDVPPGQLRLDRSCPDCGRPHGRPRLVGGGPAVTTAGDGPAPTATGDASQIGFSVSHSGDLVGVAFATAPAVGLDVEQVAPSRAEGLVDAVLSPAERADFDRLDPAGRPVGFFRYWVRKEAVLKATGEGLRVALSDLTVSAPGEPPRVVDWSGRPDAPASFTLYDLDGGPGHAASLAVVGAGLTVREYDAGALIDQAPQV